MLNTLFEKFQVFIKVIICILKLSFNLVLVVGRGLVVRVKECEGRDLP